MKRSLLSLALLMFVGYSSTAQKVEFEEFDLDNGLHVILHQDKWDMGAHRFTYVEKNLVVSATDLQDANDREKISGGGKTKKTEHYSKTHAKTGIYGLEGLYTDNKIANEDIRLVVDMSQQTKVKAY